MSITAAKLKEAKSRHVVPWHFFLQEYGKNPKSLFTFFEGEDNKYYSAYIRAIINPSSISPITCKGKSSLLKIRELQQLNKGDAWTAYFVDRDYGISTTSDPGIYTTKGYSVENLYVSKDAFSRILINEFKITPDENDKESKYIFITDMYERRLNECLLLLTEINAWLMLQKKTHIQNNSQKPFSVSSKIKPSKLLEIKLSKVKKTYEISQIESQTNTESIPQNLIDIHKNTYNDLWMCRGKFLAHFLVSFLRQLIEGLSTCSIDPTWEKHRCGLQVSKNYLSELSQYADFPDCLRNYLDAVKNQEPTS